MADSLRGGSTVGGYPIIHAGNASEMMNTLYLPSGTFKGSCRVATTGDLAASLRTINTLTGYSTTSTTPCTTTAASTTVTVGSVAALKVGAVVSVATTLLAAGTAVASIVNATTITVTNRAAITNTAITGTGTTATATFAAQKYAPYAVGAVISISGATPATYNGTWTVTACTTTSVSWASTETVAATVMGTIAIFAIPTGSATMHTFTQTIAPLSIDGVTVAYGDRVLVRAQTTVGGISATANRDNGIYFVSNPGTTSVPWVLTRDTDSDTALKIASSNVSVKAGTTYGGIAFDTDFKSTDTLGTTALVWNKVADDGKKLNFFSSTTSDELRGIISNPTGTGSLTFATSPTLVTPTLGVATATSINKVAITAPTTSATLTILNGKTLTVNNSVTLAASNDTSTLNIGTGGTLGTGAFAPRADTTTMGTLINGATEKTTPVDTDMVGLMDSAASNVVKKLSWAYIKSALKTYFDTLYPPKASPTFTGVPIAPTATSGDNSTQISTTAFVKSAIDTKDIFVAGGTAPSNTKLLWIDTNASTGGLKYYNGTAWVTVPVGYTS